MTDRHQTEMLGRKSWGAIGLDLAQQRSQRAGEAAAGQLPVKAGAHMLAAGGAHRRRLDYVRSGARPEQQRRRRHRPEGRAPRTMASTISRGPAASGASTGRPAASASTSAMPKGSRGAQCSRQAARARSSCGSARAPAISTAPCRSSSAARVRSPASVPSSPVTGPPTKRSVSSGSRAASDRSDLERQIGPLPAGDRAEHEHCRRRRWRTGVGEAFRVDARGDHPQPRARRSARIEICAPPPRTGRSRPRRGPPQRARRRQSLDPAESRDGQTPTAVSANGETGDRAPHAPGDDQLGIKIASELHAAREHVRRARARCQHAVPRCTAEIEPALRDRRARSDSPRGHAQPAVLRGMPERGSRRSRPRSRAARARRRRTRLST